jgi:phosphotriesterase-related protein
VVQTVLGDVPAGNLGFCQSHEHLWISRGYSADIYPALRIDDPEKSTAELRRYREAGGGAVLDAQPPGCGRDAEMLRKISAASGVKIIASTGFHRLLYYPEDHWIYGYGEGELEALFMMELCEGMYIRCDTEPPKKTGAFRAGQIKTALEAEFSPLHERLFTAAAKAARKAGRPLMVHVEKGSDPAALAGFLEKQGLSPDRLIFCHLDRAVADPETHRELARRGIYLEYDTIARYKYHGDEKELDIIYAMAEAGFEKQILCSLDVTRERLASYGGKPGLDYILKTFIPMLLERGLRQETADLFFYENPARVFEQA